MSDMCIDFSNIILDYVTTTIPKHHRDRYLSTHAVPATMEDVLYRLQGLLSTHNLEETLLANIIKSLFYGLWNFDKMINQHNLSTRIS